MEIFAFTCPESAVAMLTVTSLAASKFNEFNGRPMFYPRMGSKDAGSNVKWWSPFGRALLG